MSFEINPWVREVLSGEFRVGCDPERIGRTLVGLLGEILYSGRAVDDGGKVIRYLPAWAPIYTDLIFNNQDTPEILRVRNRRDRYTAGVDNSLLVDVRHSAERPWEGLLSAPESIYVVGGRIEEPSERAATKSLVTEVTTRHFRQFDNWFVNADGFWQERSQN